MNVITLYFVIRNYKSKHLFIIFHKILLTANSLDEQVEILIEDLHNQRNLVIFFYIKKRCYLSLFILQFKNLFIINNFSK